MQQLKFDLSSLNLSIGNSYQITVKSKLNNIVSIPSNIINYELLDPEQIQRVSGNWCFIINEFVADAEGDPLLVLKAKFKSNNKSYKQLTIYPNCVKYDSDIVTIGRDDAYNEFIEEYRTITFENIQIINKDAYFKLIEIAYCTDIIAPTIETGGADSQIYITDNILNDDNVVSYNIYYENDVFVENIIKDNRKMLVSTSTSQGTMVYVRAIDAIGNVSEPSNITKTADCFVAGTPVLMYDGSFKLIETCQIGDEVQSYNFNTKKYCKGVVSNLVIGESNRLAMVLLENSTYIVMSEGHPLYTVNGWHSITNKDGYPTLIKGDKVLTVSGYSEIIDLQVVDTDIIPVYSLEVMVDHNGESVNGAYFAGTGIMALHSGGTHD